MTKAKAGTTENGTQAGKSKNKQIDEQTSWSRTLRETVESIVIAFILAFLFRTFEAEAFVIPTGSMAPTLQGRHKDIACPKCGYQYRTGASEEVNSESGALKPRCGMVDAVCPMCNYTLRLNEGENGVKYPSYNGDRIIVSKFAYDLSHPERWDVVVFKYPEDAKTNYIKRLVGLPNEHLKIQHGDIYIAPGHTDDFQIARKGDKPPKLQAMLQPVYDNDYTVDALLDAGVPPRWQPWSSGVSPWTSNDKSRSFETDGKSSERAWLRYQHLIPSAITWDAVVNGNQVKPPMPQLITDAYAYNDGEFPPGCDHGRAGATYWVGDLAVDCTLTTGNQTGNVVLELIKGGRQFRATIDLATGIAKLAIVGESNYAPKAETTVRSPGTYKLSFANVDEQLLLWVNGKAITFDAPTTYPSLNNYTEVQAAPVKGNESPTDLSPVGIAVEGGAAVKVDHLNIRRDIYYIDHDMNRGTGRDIRSDIVLDNDQFFMLGDNSPRSSDGRYWGVTNYVHRSLLIGKALFIYWPHSFDQIRVGKWKIPLPFFPNFGDMGFVR